MGESHAYGTAFFCINRRLYLLSFCWIFFVLCAAVVLYWIIESGFLKLWLGDTTVYAGCTGLSCYEILSCDGLEDTTYHVLEPMTVIFGLLFLAIGIHGAHHRVRFQIQLLRFYLSVLAVATLVTIIADLIYIGVCDMYPSNIIKNYVLTLWSVMGMSSAAKSAIAALSTYPVSTVNALNTGAFNIIAWYVVLSLVWFSFLAYTAYQAQLLEKLIQRGTLGLGVHFGLDRWDESLNWDAVRIKQNRDMDSSFIDDVNLESGGQKMRFMGHGYGATKEVTSQEAVGEAMPSFVDTAWEEPQARPQTPPQAPLQSLPQASPQAPPQGPPAEAGVFIEPAEGQPAPSLMDSNFIYEVEAGDDDDDDDDEDDDDEEEPDFWWSWGSELVEEEREGRGSEAI